MMEGENKVVQTPTERVAQLEVPSLSRARHVIETCGWRRRLNVNDTPIDLQTKPFTMHARRG
jgi:hypothetical protein